MRSVLVLALVAFAGSIALLAQDSGDHPIVRKGLDTKLTASPAPLDCLSSAAQRGDPATGAAVLYMQMDAGCTVPWHWHTANESVFPISGLLQVQAKDGKPVVLKSSDYSYMPAKHVHQAKCAGTKPCTFYVELDALFDMHYVDKDGAEITAEKAVGTLNKDVKKTPKEKP